MYGDPPSRLRLREAVGIWEKGWSFKSDAPSIYGLKYIYKINASCASPECERHSGLVSNRLWDDYYEPDQSIPFTSLRGIIFVDSLMPLLSAVLFFLEFKCKSSHHPYFVHEKLCNKLFRDLRAEQVMFAATSTVGSKSIVPIEQSPPFFIQDAPPLAKVWTCCKVHCVYRSCIEYCPQFSVGLMDKSIRAKWIFTGSFRDNDSEKQAPIFCFAAIHSHAHTGMYQEVTLYHINPFDFSYPGTLYGSIFPSGCRSVQCSL